MPNSAQEWLDKGHALKQAGEYREAGSCYAKAMEADSNFLEEASLNLAECHAQQGCNGLALDCLSGVVALNPRHERAWVEMGKTFLRLADGHFNEYDIISKERTPAECYQEALRCFDQAIEVNPRADEAWFQKGCLLARNFDRVREGLECLEQARQIGGPWSSMAEMTIGSYQKNP